MIISQTAEIEDHSSRDKEPKVTNTRKEAAIQTQNADVQPEPPNPYINSNMIAMKSKKAFLSKTRAVSSKQKKIVNSKTRAVQLSTTTNADSMLGGIKETTSSMQGETVSNSNASLLLQQKGT